MMKPFHILKKRALRWLDFQLAEARSVEFSLNAQIAPTAQLEHEGSIENLLGIRENIRIGEYSHVRGRLLTYGHGGRIVIGDWCYVGVRSEIWSMESVEIGNRVLVSHDVNIHDGTAHSQNAAERHEHYRQIIQHGHPHSSENLPGVFSNPIVIEDDVWISFGVTILKGVRIGRGSVIAAGSIVTEDVPQNVLYRNKIQPLVTSLENGKVFE